MPPEAPREFGMGEKLTQRGREGKGDETPTRRGANSRLNSEPTLSASLTTARARSGTRGGTVRRARLHAQNRGEPALVLAQSLLVLGLREPTASPVPEVGDVHVQGPTEANHRTHAQRRLSTPN